MASEIKSVIVCRLDSTHRNPVAVADLLNCYLKIHGFSVKTTNDLDYAVSMWVRCSQFQFFIAIGAVIDPFSTNDDVNELLISVDSTITWFQKLLGWDDVRDHQKLLASVQEFLSEDLLLNIKTYTPQESNARS